ncbi:MAG TPA: ferritin-like domain-containing protein, partial [Pseudomonadota bacterium]|nr:ferritin-like domain-containing protein [Pseudomonadota bacterium]
GGMTMSKTNVRALLYAALGAVQAAPLALAAGCGGAVDVSLFNPIQCNNLGYIDVAGLTPAKPVNYIEYRAIGGTGAAFKTLSQSGTVCATATSPATCLSELEFQVSRAATSFRWPCVSSGLTCSRNVLATTRADEVAVAADATTVTAMLAPIDSEQDAVFVAMASGKESSCQDKNLGAVRSVAGGFEVVASTDHVCGGDGLQQYLLFVDPEGQVSEKSRYQLQPGLSGCVVGRRPVGLRPAKRDRAPTPSVVGQHLARCARLEAASVTAFLRLHDELAAHGAPQRLLRRIRSAARDEVRHARQTAALAEGHGARPLRSSVRGQRLRSLFYVARENAVEGCVRETYGALVGLWQAGHAADPEIAQHLQRIAQDEIRHATLSWDVAHWIAPRLSVRQMRALSRAQALTLAALERELLTPLEAELVTQAGLPDRVAALSLFQELRARLWPAGDALARTA